MGAFNSKTSNLNNKDSITKTKDVINQIATGYILQSDFADMMNLTDNDYCKNTIILTKDIINKHMTPIQIDDVYTSIVDKKEMQTMYVGLLNKLQVDTNTKCTKIAEFYVLINHIFNLIKKIYLVNPENNTEDLDNICNNRLNRIKIAKHNNEVVTLNNDCNVNTQNIELLEKLYENASNITTEQQAELTQLKSKIKQSEEKINDCNKTTQNQIDNNLVIKQNDPNFNDYITNIENIEQSILTGQLKLIKILDQLFLGINQNDNSITTMKYTIHPDLTMAKLEKLAIETRSTITGMYSKCEENYMKNIMIQEKIRDVQQKSIL